MKVTYSSNNSGGEWWLTDSDWKNLEEAGWKVKWFRDNPVDGNENSERFLGALASDATREGLSLEEAIEEFERITGCDADAEGCECCGRPHYFYTEQ